MAIRTYKVTLDSKNTIAPEPVYLRQGDKTGAVVIDATLMDNGVPVALDGLTPMFKANTADGQAVIADSTGFNVLDSANGEFTYQVPNALSAVPGKIKVAYFSFSNSSGSESTFDVPFVICSAVDITQKQADDYITIIDGTIDSLSDKINRLNTDLKNILDNYNSGDFYNKAQTDSKDSATLSNAKLYVDSSISSILSVPETFPDLASIKAKYPNGASGVMVAADNGHKYIWNGTVWADSGIYQAVGLAESQITSKSVSSIASGDVFISEIKDADKNSWNDPNQTLTFSFDPQTGSFSATTPSGSMPNTGIMLDVQRKSGDYDLIFTNVNSNLSILAAYILKKDGTLLNQVGNAFTGGATNGTATIHISEVSLSSIAIGDTFRVLINVKSVDAGGKQVTGNVRLLRSGDISLKGADSLNGALAKIHDYIDNVGLIKNNIVVDTQWKKWFSDANYQTNSDGSLTFWSSETGDPGPMFPITSPLFNGSIVYVYFEIKKVSGSAAGVKIQLVSNNVNVNPSTGFRIADPVNVKVSNDWESYMVPIQLNDTWLAQDTSKSFAIISAIRGTDNKMILRNVAVMHSVDPSINMQIETANISSTNSIVEFSNGLRKGEFLNSDSTDSLLPKVHYVTPANSVADNGICLDSITVNLKTAENVTFAIGVLDQNNLLVPSRTFTLNLPAGQKTFIFQQDIPIPAGSRLFMECHNQGVLYQSSSSTENILVQDEDHSFNQNGYSGYQFYTSSLMSPFSYRVRNSKIESDVKNISDNVVTMQSDILSLESGTNVFKSPSGKRFAINVNDDGSISTVSLDPKKMFVYGNSLTVGFDGFGMATSKEANDWVHLVAAKVRETNSDFSFSVMDGRDWESSTTSADRLSVLNNKVAAQLPSDADLVIIQLGDNINTPEKLSSYADDAKTMVTWFRQKLPKARIVWVAQWFSDQLIPIAEAACNERGALLCDISKYDRDPQYKSAVGNVWTDREGVQHTIDNPGVALHPGDLGMQMIANTVLNTLGIG